VENITQPSLDLPMDLMRPDAALQRGDQLTDHNRQQHGRFLVDADRLGGKHMLGAWSTLIHVSTKDPILSAELHGEVLLAAGDPNCNR
jgi:hypothetical protein